MPRGLGQENLNFRGEARNFEREKVDIQCAHWMEDKRHTPWYPDKAFSDGELRS